MCVCMFVYMCMCVWMHLYIHVLCVHGYVCIVCASVCTWDVHVCIHGCMGWGRCVHVCVCMCVLCMGVCKSVCMYVYMGGLCGCGRGVHWCMCGCVWWNVRGCWRVGVWACGGCWANELICRGQRRMLNVFLYHSLLYSFNKWFLGGWRNGSEVKNTGYSSEGPEFKSQQPHGSSQPSVTRSDTLFWSVWRQLQCIYI
jgi:hypothetical protein